jgi:hypothetical protein
VGDEWRLTATASGRELHPEAVNPPPHNLHSLTHPLTTHTAQRLYASSSDAIPCSFFSGTNSCAT